MAEAAEPFSSLRGIASQRRSAEHIFRDNRAKPQIPMAISAALWLIARWFYSNPRGAKFSSAKKMAVS